MHPDTAALYAKIDAYEEALLDILRLSKLQIDVMTIAKRALRENYPIRLEATDGKKKV